MELWLLGAGAIALIAITLWIVWPSSTADTVGTTTVPIEEDRPMTQYTSPTADMAPGGVATAEPARAEREEQSHHWAPSGAGSDYSSPLQTQSRSMMPARTMGMGAGALLSIGGAIGGAWLYARWQRERNKPINRLRRGARDVASRLGERMPDVEDLPHGAAPMSGAATALLLTGLVASRAMRRSPADHPDEIRDRATDLLRMPTDRLSGGQQRRPAIFGIGFGGLAILAGGTYLVWRLLRSGERPNTTWTSYTPE